jgi:acetolactate synthase regulatory subunit
MGEATAERATYVVRLTGSRNEALLLRIVSLLRRKQALVVSLSMHDAPAGRRLSIRLDLPPERLDYVCAQLRNVVDVYDVVVTPYADGEDSSS